MTAEATLSTIVHPPDIEAIAAIGAVLLTPPPASDLDAAREYVRLFVDPMGPCCPPWQSLYEEPGADPAGPRLMGAAHHSALAWFQRFGFEPANRSEPADHIGLLLLFYAKFLGTEGVSENTLEQFEEAHLTWVPEFVRRLRAANPAEPYRQAAETLAKLFL